MVRSVNVKKTKSSKKIVLKITMSMTHTLYLGPEHRALINDGGLVDLEVVNFPPNYIQLSPMPFQAPTVTVSTFLEHFHHGLLIDNQISNHFLNATHPFLELLVFLDHSLPLERPIISLDYIVKG